MSGWSAYLDSIEANCGCHNVDLVGIFMQGNFVFFNHHSVKDFLEKLQF